MIRKCLILVLGLLAASSCKPETYTPKPRGYYKIPLPEKHEYQAFDSTGFPYRFEYPVYGKIKGNTEEVGIKPDNPYWVNIEFPDIGGRIHLSYKQINQNHSLGYLNEDMYELTFGVHNKKANYIKDHYLSDTARNVHVVLYNVTGDAASAFQFYATDSTKHFIRGALYFEATPNSDSLKPVNEFLKKDIEHLLNTIEWK